MILALLLAAAPAVEHEQVSESHHRLTVAAAGEIAASQARLMPTARSICGDREPAFGSFTLTEEVLEQELFCLPAPEAGEDERLDVLARTYAWLAGRDSARYEDAWALLSDRIKASSPVAEWSAAAASFNDAAGPVRRRQVTRITVYENPPDAPEPGLYVAADFSADFANLEFACGYLMWHRQAGGGWTLVREERNFVHREAGEALTSLDRPRLRERMGCRD